MSKSDRQWRRARVRARRDAGLPAVAGEPSGQVPGSVADAMASAAAVTLSREQGREMLAERVQRHLGMSLEDFEDAYYAGRLDLEAPHVAHLAMLLPFAR